MKKKKTPPKEDLNITLYLGIEGFKVFEQAIQERLEYEKEKASKKVKEKV